MKFLLHIILFFCVSSATFITKAENTTKAEKLTLTLGVLKNSRDAVLPDIIPKITEAFESIDVKVIIRPVASNRLEQLVNQGVLDGDIMRRKDFYKSARLWPISTPVANFDFWVWTHLDNVKHIKAVNDLKALDLISITNFAYFDMVPWYQKKIEQADVYAAVKYVASHGGYTLLPKRILELNIPITYLSKIDTVLEKPVVQLEFHTWLNHRHIHLREKISAAYARVFSKSNNTATSETKPVPQPNDP